MGRYASPNASTIANSYLSCAAYYNAGSVALFVIIVACLISLCLWCRLRHRRVGPSKINIAEENIPLNSTSTEYEYDEGIGRKRKGKERATEHELSTAIFDVGEDEDEDEHRKTDEHS